MTTGLDVLGIRRRLGRKQWSAPEQIGPDVWRFTAWVPEQPIHPESGAWVPVGSVIVSYTDHPEAGAWVHASRAWVDHLPSYDEMCELHAAVWPDGHAVQQHVPPSRHVNHHPYALHLWGRADGASLLPPELDARIDALGMV